MKEPRNDNRPPIALAEVSEEWLRAWLEAGYMTQAEYEAEMARRKAAGRDPRPRG